MSTYHVIHKITHPSEGPSTALANLDTNIFFGRQLFFMLRTHVSALSDLLVAMTTSGYATMAARYCRPSCLSFLHIDLSIEVVFSVVLGLSAVPRFDFLLDY